MYTYLRYDDRKKFNKHINIFFNRFWLKKSPYLCFQALEVIFG